MTLKADVKPVTLEAIVECGYAWAINTDMACATFSYRSNDDCVNAAYTFEELDAIDVRLRPFLSAAEGCCGSRMDVQEALRASHRLWHTKYWSLARWNHPVCCVHDVKTIMPSTPTSIQPTFSYYKPIRGTTHSTPFVKRNHVITVNAEVTLEAMEDCFPGFAAAYVIAQGLALTPRETALYCMQQVGFQHNSYAVPPTELPFDLQL